MTCATCGKAITLNSFFEFKKYFCSKECRDKHRDKHPIVFMMEKYSKMPIKDLPGVVELNKKNWAQKGFNTEFDETEN